MYFNCLHTMYVIFSCFIGDCHLIKYIILTIGAYPGFYNGRGDGGGGGGSGFRLAPLGNLS